MNWFILAIIIIFAFLLLGKLGSSNSKKSNNKGRKKRKGVSTDAKEIAANVTTIQQFRSLERKLEKAEERISNVESERAYETASNKHDVLQEAVILAESKIYQWQFIPSVDLHTPKSTLEHAYKVYSNEEYVKLNNSIGGDERDWYGMDGYGEKEDPEPYIKSLMKFRAIVESNDSQEEKTKKINQLVAKNKSFADEFFEIDGVLKPGDQWFADSLHNADLPLADQLYSEGYTTPEKCLEIDPIEFLKRKGVGPKKVEQLEKFQSRVKSGSRNA